MPFDPDRFIDDCCTATADAEPQRAVREVLTRAVSEPRDVLAALGAPERPGIRSLYRAGQGMIALWAVERDASGRARDIALAYGRAIGCARAGLIASSFAEEAEADLFNEQAVVWGGVPELLVAGFDTLVAGGVAPEVAYLECVGELHLIAGLIAYTWRPVKPSPGIRPDEVLLPPIVL